MDQSHLAAGSKNEQRMTTTLNRRSFLRIASGAIAAAALSQFAPFIDGRAHAQSSSGLQLYSLQNIGQRPPFVLETGSGRRVGCAYRAGWKQTEPREGVYDWSLIDAALGDAALNGVPFALSVTAGTRTPTWVYDAGAKAFEFQDADASMVMPIPWDEVYKLRWVNFIAALGRRYGDRLSRIALTGVNSTTQETLLPADPGALADWEAVGYTNDKIRQAFKDIGSRIVAAFPPSVPVAGMHGKSFLPSLPGHPDCTMELIDFGVARWPNYVMQYNGAVGVPPLLWSGVNTYLTKYPGRTLGLQAGAPLGEMYLHGTITQAESLGAAWLELYPPDLAFI
jgi:Beta-galactosidase